MKKSTITTLVLTILFLGAGIGLVAYAVAAPPEVVRVSDDFSFFFSYSYTYSSYDTHKLEVMFDIGRTLITCGILMLGFTLVLADVGCGEKKKDRKAKKAACNCSYEAAKAEASPAQPAQPAAAPVQPAAAPVAPAAPAEEGPKAEGEAKTAGPDEVIHL